MTENLILHEYSQSGNCYKIRLTAAHVGTPLERREYDIIKGETRTPDFLRNVNANGRIPVLQIGDRFLPESNAACVYLAHGTDLIPTERFDHADMLRWMSFEQYSHEPNIATLRFWLAFVGEDKLSEAQRDMLPAKRKAGEDALAVMDEHLSANDWFAAGRFTLADIALLAYTHVAGEGGFDLGRYPSVFRWVGRVQSLSGHVAIKA
ncbi:glutathione S-transferase family protein [Sphingomonas piscis]|uniref:Glutathione S-transferase family protein n=1 Tax=Sphingomonas piscis TaxID=2714943 RepID=A0A6G7YM80_9SPHN|nr:glutathione S-transferase family protein [Sphingomonas piscis]QIK77855.1 glutathione S-transferase family protein [Sphingomonas piscis]